MGDCATIKDHDLPATAQVAQQKAQYLGDGKCQYFFVINHRAEAIVH
jgi:NADH dehydrogenase FAD-containing subunit